MTSDNITNCINRLREFNAWRRGEDGYEMPDPKDIGKTIDQAIELLEQSKHKNRLINPCPKPRHDEVFVAGLKMLDSS